MAENRPTEQVQEQAQATYSKQGGDTNPLDTTGLCLLSLDSGGVRGLATLYILKNIMDRLNHLRKEVSLPPVKPCEVFDLIGGTSTGGLIVIMLGRLEMDVDGCIAAYSSLAKAVFQKKLHFLPVNFKGKIVSRFDSERLKAAILEVIKHSGASESDLFDDGTNRGCRKKIAVKLARQNVVEVPSMEKDAAVQLLEKCLIHPELVNNREDTTALLSQFNHLPLAIVQAAAYVNENGLSLADYLLLLNEQEEEVIDLLSEGYFEDDGRHHGVKNPIATTWLISFERIRQHDPLAADYLSFMACVEPKDIPQSLLPPGPSRRRETEAIGTLSAYSFISRRPDDQAIDIHRLVHLATRNWLRKEKKLAQSTEKTIVRLQNVFPDSSHKNRTLWRKYLPHARYALDSNLVSEDWQTRTDLKWRYGMCLFEDGRWNEAEAPIAQVVENRKSVFGVENACTLIGMTALASIYKNQGHWRDAEAGFAEVLRLTENVADSEEFELLAVMAELAATYREMGEWKRAEAIEEDVLSAR